MESKTLIKCEFCKQYHEITDEEIVRDVVFEQMMKLYTCSTKKKCECGKGEIIEETQDTAAMMRYYTANFDAHVSQIMKDPEKITAFKHVWYLKQIEKQQERRNLSMRTTP